MRPLTASLVLALAALTSIPVFAELPAEIKVGAMETLTGDSSVYGLSIKNGFDLAVDEINASKLLGASKIKFTVYDEKADKQEGISVINKLINDDKVSALFGPTLSSVAFAADPVAQKAGVSVIGTSTTAVGITAMGDYIFRDSLPQAAVIPGTINAVKAKFGNKKAVLMFESTNEYSKSESEVFKAALKAAGIELAATESYSKGDTDFRTQLRKLMLRKPDMLVLASLAGEAVPILQQVKEIGFKGQLVGGNGFNSPNVAKVAKEAAEGLMVGASWFIESPAVKSKAFVAAYQKKYGVAPDQFAAQAYTGMFILAEAFKNAGSADRTAVRDALAKVKDLETALGKFSFDANRDPVHPSVVLVVKSGAYTLLQ
jgi:branched-chain amino acid transport system substrate-binding protein